MQFYQYGVKTFPAISLISKLTRGPLVLYRSPEYWGYVEISGYWGNEVIKILNLSDLDQGQWMTLTFGAHKALI